MDWTVRLKRAALPVLFALSCGTAIGELTKDEIHRLEDVEIAGIRVTRMRDDDRNKIEVVEINTFQNEDDDGDGFRMRVVVEITDKEKNRYLVDFTGDRPGGLDSEYTGEDYWTLYIPYGKFSRFAVTGYAVQYGTMNDDQFVVFAEDYDNVETVDELLERSSTPYPETVRLKHYYMYEDEEEGETESISRDVRPVKPKK